jgi:DNA mismatch repair protein MutH
LRAALGKGKPHSSRPLVPPTAAQSALHAAPFANEGALLRAARALAGFTLSELAHAVCQGLPAQPLRDKGFIGRVAERALGLHHHAVSPLIAASDFAALGIELKTLPVTSALTPRESTFVCYVPLTQLTELSWEESRVAHKLARVLFLPIESGRALQFGARRFGRAFMWSPNAEQTELLRADYNELARRVQEGHAEALDARVGRVMQLRPKAAHGGVRVRVTDGDGMPWRIQPRGFYLRASFTKQILQAALGEHT